MSGMYLQCGTAMSVAEFTFFLMARREIKIRK